jgi:uncharacterized membrane protein
MATLASIHLGPIQFDQPAWLWLIPILWALAVWIGRSTLSGMGTTARRVALAVRLIVIALLVAALAEPSWRKESKSVAVTVIVDQSKSVPLSEQARAETYLQKSAETAEKGDALGRVTVAREAYVQSLPGPPQERPDTQQIISRDGTNLEDGLRLGLAVLPEDKANRVVLITDGNETVGSLLAAAEAAKAAGVPIDVLPLRFRNEREVIVERLIAPATARMGETINLRVLINATAPAAGTLSIRSNGEVLDLDPDSPAFGTYVELEAGMNPLSIPLPMTAAGVQSFEAIFEPITGPGGEAIGDTIPENNRALAVTFVSGEGRILLLTTSTEDAAALVNALTEARIQTDVRAPTEAFQSLVELGVYDAVIMVNTPAYAYSQQQQEDLRAYVHDIGGGLIMIGGPESFGAGGWIGSPVADALPVKLDPPQKRQMPRGALALIMHSCEMPEGNYWGQKTAEAAIGNLSRQDLVGIVEYSWQAGGDVWVYPLSEVGDGSGARRAIKNLTFGDVQDFNGMMRMAISSLEKANAGQKHAIIISDGDPTPPTRDIIQRYIKAGVTVSTVLVFPHNPVPGGPDWQTMQDIARVTGGRFYPVTNRNQLTSLPEIFIKEAQTVRRSLIWEGDPFRPTLSGLADAMRRIPTPVPDIRGYVVTAEREGLTQVVLRGHENDPILATWQYGLGKAVAFTSDASTRWAPSWVGWPAFRQFWEQHVRWAMRPGGSADIRIITEDQGERTKLIVEALTPEGDRLNFLQFNGRVVGPGGVADAVELRQVGPGRYEGSIDSSTPGSYVMNFRYAAPAPDGSMREGNVQAAVTRPFADEFRALEDNSALLAQVAALTGGRVLRGDPRADQLWTREGLRMPVALTPIWLVVAMIAIGMFLVDVAVRRVRIDIAAMGRAVRKGLERRRTQAGQQLASLREARERAQQAMAERGKPASAQEQTAERPAISMPADATRTVKFEATAEELAAAKRGGGLDDKIDLLSPQPGETPTRTDGGKAKPAASDKEENISRLLKAKKRAQDQMESE